MLRTVGDWANNKRYQPAAVSKFLDGADCWPVAHASAHECTLVTHEVPAVTTTKIKIKIPDACIGHDVRYIGPYEMLRREGARFVLGPLR